MLRCLDNIYVFEPYAEGADHLKAGGGIHEFPVDSIAGEADNAILV